MSLEKLIESHYAPKKGNELLVKLIESKLNEDFNIPVPEITAGIGKGEIKDLRKIYQDMLSTPLGKNITKKTSMKERIDIINQYLDPQKSNIPNMNLQDFIASFIYIQEFEKIIREYDPYDPKMSGMRHEMLSSVVMDGTEIFGVLIPDAVIEDKNFSFKYISKAGKAGFDKGGGVNRGGYPSVDGSLYNFLDLMSQGETVIYLLCLKSSKQNKYEFKAFQVTPNNFMSILNTTGKFRSSFVMTHKLTETIKANVGFKPLDNLSEINLSNYNHISLFQGNTQKLAKLIMELIGTDLSSMVLFTANFLKLVSDVQNTGRSFYDPEIEYYTEQDGTEKIRWGAVPYNNQGTLIIDSSKVQNIKDVYRGSIYGKVFDFFKEGQALLTNVRDFLSKNTTVEEANRIENSIDSIKEKFVNISSETLGTNQMELPL